MDISLHIGESRLVLPIPNPFHKLNIEFKIYWEFSSSSTMRLITCVACIWKLILLDTPVEEKLLVHVLLSNLVILVVEDHSSKGRQSHSPASCALCPACSNTAALSLFASRI